jgi:hypothetical protein
VRMASLALTLTDSRVGCIKCVTAGIRN